MISDSDLNELLSYKQKDAKLIFIGDKAQLKPIDSTAIVSNTFIGGEYFELKEMMRSIEPLTEFTNYIRNQIMYFYDNNIFNDRDIISSKMNFPDTEINGNGYYMLNYEDDMIDKFIERYLKDPKNPMHVKISAYKNKTIDDLNTKIRERLFPNTDYLFSIGDNLIINSYYNNGEDVLKNNEFVAVTKVRKGIDNNNLNVYFLDIINQKEEEFFNLAVIDKSQGYQSYMIKKNMMLRKAKERKISWKQYYEFIEGYLNVSYSFCSTAHKLQGQTVSNIFVYENEIKSVHPISTLEKMQAIYVSMSRAKHNIYML
jgi:hypothetical protein